MIQGVINIDPRIVMLILPLLIWEIIWKGIGLWKSARNNQMEWFIAILVINTCGILPILYWGIFQKKKRK